MSEAGYAGAFSIEATSTCLTHVNDAAAASISPTSGATSFSVTPGAASSEPGGTCDFIVQDASGNTAAYNVAVTNTTVTGK